MVFYFFQDFAIHFLLREKLCTYYFSKLLQILPCSSPIWASVTCQLFISGHRALLLQPMRPALGLPGCYLLISFSLSFLMTPSSFPGKLVTIFFLGKRYVISRPAIDSMSHCSITPNSLQPGLPMILG